MNDGGSMKMIHALELHIEALNDAWDEYDPDGAVAAAAEAVAALKENDVKNG